MTWMLFLAGWEVEPGAIPEWRPAPVDRGPGPHADEGSLQSPQQHLRVLSEFSLPGSPWSQAAEPFHQGFINLPGQGSMADMHKAGLRFGAEAGKVNR